MSKPAKQKKSPDAPWAADFVDLICRRLRDSERVRRTLPLWGRVHIDRPLPFLCVYRRPTRRDSAGSERLVTSEASYVICSGSPRMHSRLSELVSSVSEILVGQFGACLVLEIWDAPPTVPEAPVTTAKLVPQFRLLATREASDESFTECLETALGRVKLGRCKAKVAVQSAGKSCPRSMRPLLDATVAAEMGCLLYGLEVSPIYRSAETGEVFPTVLRRFRRGLSLALRRSFYDFSREHTTHRPAHYHALGRSAVVKAVWEVDRLLAEASDQFDFLLQLTPVNTEQAWKAFRRSDYERKPVFHYRPLPAEPVVLKRKLYRAPVERIEDPALAQILREKVVEVDRQITMLQDRNTPKCLHESVQLFGGVEDELLELALEILEMIPPGSREPSSKRTLRAADVAGLARAEIEFLRGQYPEVNSTVEVRPDITGLIVSQGNLLIGSHLRVPEFRINALLQHEIGTHVLTFWNGRAQPFRQLYTGLAGYDDLQEGLAVLAEYLVGGLSRPRLRLLAARVLAVHFLVDGASFVDSYRALWGQYGFARRTAFGIAMRVYRGGGLTKDACYLRGLLKVLQYLAKGGGMECLFIGKIGVEHVPIVQELLWRGVLRAPPLTPRYMGEPRTEEKLKQLRQGMTLIELVERKSK